MGRPTSSLRPAGVACDLSARVFWGSPDPAPPCVRRGRVTGTISSRASASTEWLTALDDPTAERTDHCSRRSTSPGRRSSWGSVGLTRFAELALACGHDHARGVHRPDDRAAAGADPQRVRQRRHPRLRRGDAQLRSARHLPRRRRPRRRTVHAAAGTRLDGRPDRGNRSRRSVAVPDGPHRCRAGESRRLAQRPVRRRGDRRRGVGSRRHRHAQPHLVDGRRVPAARRPRGSDPRATSSTSASPTRRPAASGEPSGWSSTTGTRSTPTTC